jgi:hypothetical protein
MVTADPLASWWRHTVTVEDCTGSGAYGDQYGDPYQLTGFVTAKRTVVFDANGDQSGADALVLLPKGTPPPPLKSRVTSPLLDRPRYVVSVAVHDGGGQPTPDHVELAVR